MPPVFFAIHMNSIHRRRYLLVCVALFVASLLPNRRACAQSSAAPLLYLDRSLAAERRIADLLARMTVEEKAAQLANTFAQYLTDMPEYTGKYALQPKGIGGLNFERYSTNYGAVQTAEQINGLHQKIKRETRLGIPPIVHAEGLHGVCSNGFTVFPQAIALASTWNPALVSEVSTVIAKEARAIGIRQFLSPVLNVARDPRWGRTEETYGEDPFLISRIGVAFCKPVEQAGIVTTPKHFELNFTDGGRESNAAHISQRLMEEIYFPAYKAAFKEAGSRSLMLAYNSIDGVPSASNRWLIQDMLRDRLGFNGFTVTDYNGLLRIENRHHTATSPEDIAAQSINAGLEKEFPDPVFFDKPLVNAVAKGLVSMATLDTAVARVLRAKFSLGLFDETTVKVEDVAKNVDTKEHRELAYCTALQSIVLLKNDGQTLPFNKAKTIALIGPNADVALTGGYSGWGVKTVSPLEGLQQRGITVKHVKTSWLTANTLPAVPASSLFHKDKTGKLVPGVEAVYYKNSTLSGEPMKSVVEANIAQFGHSVEEPIWDGGKVLVPISVRWKGFFKAPHTYNGKLGFRAAGGVRMKVDDKMVIDEWGGGRLKRTVEPVVPFQFVKDKLYQFEVEYYNYPSSVTDNFLEWEAAPFTATADSKAVEAAKASDAVVFVANISEGEKSDRGYLNLSPSQEKIIQLLAAARKPFAVVIIGGGVITMTNWVDKVPAVVEAWYPGEEGGGALADILLGRHNPGGKLPINFPVSEAQLPIYYNQKPAGRGYYDYNNLTGFPLFPFGHGLSYTTFGYSNLRFSSDTIGLSESIDVLVDVKNTGAVQGDEVVQLYLRDEYASVARPLKELKGFQRITLVPGETKTVRLTLTGDELMMLDKDMKWVVEPGSFNVMIGASSEDIRLQKVFWVKGK